MSFIASIVSACVMDLFGNPAASLSSSHTNDLLGTVLPLSHRNSVIRLTLDSRSIRESDQPNFLSVITACGVVDSGNSLIHV